MLLQKPALLFTSSTYNSAAQINLNHISKDQKAMLHSQNETVLFLLLLISKSV